MNQAFRNIVNMLHGVRDGLVRDANNYEQQEQASQQILRHLVRFQVKIPITSTNLLCTVHIRPTIGSWHCG